MEDARSKQGGRRPQQWRKMFGILLLALLAASCQAPAPGRAPALAPERPPAADEALLSVFLHLAGPEPMGLWMELASVELVGEERVALLSAGARRFAAAEIGAGQRFVARGPAPAGRYRSLRLTVERAGRQRQGEQHFLAVPEPVLDLPLPGDFRLEAGESRSLFLAWDEEGSVRERAFFHPRLAALPQQPPLLADLAYVSCPEIDTVYLLRTDSNRVCGSLAVPGRPSRLAYDRQRGRLYVLAAAGAAVHVVEAATGRVLDRFTVPMTAHPSFLLLSSDGRWGYVLDEEADQLLRIDLGQGALDKRLRLGGKPRFLAWTDDGRLALSLGLSREVHILDPETLATREVLSVPGGPDGLLATDGHLYVAESSANTVSVFALRSGQLSARLNVGLMPRRLALGDGRIYVSNQMEGSLTLLAPAQQRVLREIPVGPAPLEMAAAARRKWLYVAEEGGAGLAVIDQTSNRLVGRIELGARPGHLVVAQ
jgi:DNA-binding beta-propeller fold protein YncE